MQVCLAPQKDCGDSGLLKEIASFSHFLQFEVWDEDFC